MTPPPPPKARRPELLPLPPEFGPAVHVNPWRITLIQSVPGPTGNRVRIHTRETVIESQMLTASTAAAVIARILETIANGGPA